MRKLLSYVVVFSLLFSSFQFIPASLTSITASSKNKGATFITNRFIPVGNSRDGLPLTGGRQFPWQATANIRIWGNPSYPMPHAALARDLNTGINLPATEPGWSVQPVLWTEFFLSVQPAGPKSQIHDRWYAILDDAGQLWLDPDGTFHDPRYNAKADPRNKHYEAGSCRTASNKQHGISRYCVDPASDNNTQGPYILSPTHPLFTDGPLIFQAENTLYGSRKWQIGFTDLVDYPRFRVVNHNRPNDEHEVLFDPLADSVQANQWDLGLEIVPFRRRYPTATQVTDPQYVSVGDEMHHEYHNTGVFTGFYKPYQYIYRKNPVLPDNYNGTQDQYATNYVQVGDVRLSDMSFKTWEGNTVINYPANSIVQWNDADAPVDRDRNGLLENDEVRALNHFLPCARHTETVRQFDRNRYEQAVSTYGPTSQEAWDLAPSFDTEFRHGYQYSEFIYCDINYSDDVTIGDFRYSPVNTRLDPATLQPVNGLGLVGFDVLTKTQGDALILSELLLGGCEAPTYDISVQTDLWMGIDNHIGTDKPIVPSVTAARLHSPNGDITANAQRIQKNTVLDPTGLEFFIPSTTFHNIKLQYRQYIGVEIFKDNGIDNHLGINLASNKLYEQNLTDDYLPERMGEEFVGAVNGVNAKDYGMPLTPFTDNIRYYDTANPEEPREALYGCGEPIYEISYDNMQAFNQALLLTPDLVYTVKAGDRRITGLTVTVGSNEIVYAPDTLVTVGDADVGFSLYPFDANKYFFVDKVHPDKEIVLNRKYDLGEAIYLNTKLGVDWSTTPPQYTPFPYARRFPALDASSNPTNYVKYVTRANAGGHASKTIPTYIDVDLNGRVSMGDIRLTEVRDLRTSNRYYKAYSTVQENDTDAQANLLMTIPTRMGVNMWYAKAGYNIFTPTSEWNRFNDVYIDTNNDSMVSGVSQRSPRDNADIRLSNTFGYGIGSTVYDQQANGLWDAINDQHDDRDVGNWDDPTSNPRNFDIDSIAPALPLPSINAFTISITQDGLFFLDPLDPYATDSWHPASVQLTPMTVDSRFIRLTEVAISDTTYACGSNVSSGDFWYNQNPVHRLSMGLNCDFRFIDAVVQPGPVSVNIKVSAPFKVEQTSQVDISLATPLKKGEEVWVLVQDVWAPNATAQNMINPFTHVYKLDIDKQTVSFQYTPYRGSCGEFSTNYPLRIYTFKEVGGVKEPVPPNAGSGLYLDPFYSNFLNTDEKGNIVTTDAPVPPVPPIPSGIAYTYDCYNTREYNVLPEDMLVSSASKCIDVLSQRFPNLTVRLYDGDNPNDVNDPSNIRLSLTNGEELVANYNAAGAGIEYLFTGWAEEWLAIRDGQIAQPTTLNQNSTPKIHSYGKVIVQINKNGSFNYWYWMDEYPFNVLDKNDVLSAKYTAYDRLIWDNADCSDRNSCYRGTPDFMYNNEITKGDRYYIGNETFFTVENFGVNALATNYNEVPGNPGGEVRIAVAPNDATSKLKLRFYTTNALYDYNNTIQHPPHFIFDPSAGIDYSGILELKVLPPDPYVNFAEFKIVDHALQNSQVNYTSGFNPLYDLPVPAPQIEAPYDPIVKDVGRDFRAYPGGQTHTGRIRGMVNSGSFLRTEGQHNGWNAYPAIWWWYWYQNVNMNNFTDFNKLGTEFYPLTDYSLYFIMKDGDGKHMTLDPDPLIPLDQRVRQLRIVGPFMTPAVYNEERKSIISDWRYNGTDHPPLKYDYSGEIIIDENNFMDYQGYFGQNGGDWTQSQWNGANDVPYTYLNEYLRFGRDLDYSRVSDVVRIPEIIPVGSGVVRIEATLWDGTLKIFQDCCAEPPTDGVDVHGLEIETALKGVTVSMDNKVEITLKDHDPMQTVQPANNAVVLVWQDRGIINTRTGRYDGAGDGWITYPPSSSEATDVQFQFDRSADINGDGKVSFAEYETEIIGTYDLATNTWLSGLIDARTFQRDNGKYIFDLNAANGAQVTQVGLDFGGLDRGGLGKDPDHIISAFEALPVNITAYKYGDDNNDRAFTPLYNMGDNLAQFSHEVYIAGQKALDVLPIQDMSITISPSLLTAGTIPELVDPASPLTVIVTNAEGEPVDLSYGVPNYKGETKIDFDDMWNNLFHDVHPETLPQYYWLRTDLHNNDFTRINNNKLYGRYFNPIAPDFTLAKDGKYSFRGFCANDQGEFDIVVYTPDRKHMGIGTVVVKLPNVEYQISNTEDQSGTEFTLPGQPDFFMTAADNRIYKVRATVKDARGILIKGVTKGVSTCGGGTRNTARFTPYSTRPMSWEFTERDKFLFADHFMQELYPYNLHIAFDFNDNQQIDPKNSELYSFSGFNSKDRGMVYYNTMNFMNDKLEWDIEVNPNLPPVKTSTTQKPRLDPPGNPNQPKRPESPDQTIVGWGLGSIYNNPYHGGYLFLDIDHTKYLDYHDSLGLDVNGQTEFYLFAEDIAHVGGLIGHNFYGNNAQEADLVGAPPPNKTDPKRVERRFIPGRSNDGVFFLDWEAFPDNELVIAPPQFKVLHAQSRIELGKELLNKENYDLTYSVENHLIVQVLPADSRDLAIHENSRVFMLGNQHQTAIYGQLKKTQIDDPKIMETTLHFTPTGLNEAIAHLGFYNPNKYYLTGPYDLKNTSTYTLLNLIQFDAALGLYVEALSDGPIVINKGNEILVRVKEVGTMAPVENATVKIEGPGISASKQTDKSGIAVFPINANGKGVVKVHASKEGRVIGYKELPIIEDLSKPFLDVYPLAPLTNKTQIEVTGYTNPGNSVTLQGNVTATVDDKGNFKASVTLKEGLNTILVEARNTRGEVAKASVTTTLDTQPPNIFIDDPGRLVDVKEAIITGRTEPNAEVKLNGKPVTLTHDIFRGTIPVTLGKNTITVESTDQAGNKSTATREIYVYHRITLKLTIDNPVVTINDEAQPALEAPPYISRGRTFVPVRIITEAFGAKVDWEDSSKTVTITLGEKVVVMQVGNPEALINGKKVMLDAPPEIRSGRTFVPIRFISEAFGAIVEWDAATRTVTVIYEK